jgi:rhodanese-related sulfurtransferase
LGKVIEPNELIKPEYIGSPSGSSLAELKKAAEKNGLYASAVAKLSTKDLKNLTYPFILHVKTSLTNKKYTHYELFLGTKQGKALIYDPPIPIELVEFWSLAPRWDGSGLVVSNKPLNLNSVFASSRFRFAFYVGIALVFIISVRWVRKQFFCLPKGLSRKQSILLSFYQCAALALTAILFALVYNSINDTGLIIRKQAANSIQKSYQSTFLPKVGEGKARRLIEKQQALFIDARPDFAFKTNHIKNAINVPSNLTDNERVITMSKIAKNARIIVYCQDPRCRQADNLAIKLISDGFTNVTIYKGKLERLKGITK